MYITSYFKFYVNNLKRSRTRSANETLDVSGYKLFYLILKRKIKLFSILPISNFGETSKEEVVFDICFSADLISVDICFSTEQISHCLLKSRK